MESDLERRVGQLERRLQRMEQELEGERERAAAGRRRAAWVRLGIILAVAVAYAAYFQSLTSMF